MSSPKKVAILEADMTVVEVRGMHVLVLVVLMLLSLYKINM
jgi:hypothetical protein